MLLLGRVAELGWDVEVAVGEVAVEEVESVRVCVASITVAEVEGEADWDENGEVDSDESVEVEDIGKGGLFIGCVGFVGPAIVEVLIVLCPLSTLALAVIVTTA